MMPGDLLARLALALQANPGGAAGPPTSLLLRELAAVPGLLAQIADDVAAAPARNPGHVILLPGFLTGTSLMRPLEQALVAAGHTVSDWGEGLNLGLTADNLDGLVARLAAMSRDEERKLSLVGWSLGGLFAREAARRAPQAVARVITLGSPFSGDRHANHAWRLYHLVAGHPVDAPPGIDDLAAKPPVPTTAIWSAIDGIIAPAAARGLEGERDRAVEVGCVHMRMPLDAGTIAAVLHELDRSE